MKNIFLTMLIVAELISCDNAPMTKTEREGEPNIYSTSDDDDKMNKAIALAKQTLTTFDTAYISKLYDTSTFAIKLKFPTSNGHEHIWATSITIIDGQYFGIVDNLPDLTTKVKLGDKIILDRENISDWMYSDKGVLRGGYTIRVIRNQMTNDDRKNSMLNFHLKSTTKKCFKTATSIYGQKTRTHNNGFAKYGRQNTALNTFGILISFCTLAVVN
jgi:uncharacterized protein YegJ (DUF2314 family)